MPSKQMKITLDAKSVAAGAIAAVRQEMQEVADLGNDLLQLWAKAADDPDYRGYLNELLPALKASTPLAAPGSVQHLMNSGAHGTLHSPHTSSEREELQVHRTGTAPNPHAHNIHIPTDVLKSQEEAALAMRASGPLVEPSTYLEHGRTPGIRTGFAAEPPLGDMEYYADEPTDLPPVAAKPRDGQFLTAADLAGATQTQVPIRVGDPAPEQEPDEQPEQLATAGTPLPQASQESVDRLLGKTTVGDATPELSPEDEASELRAAAEPALDEFLEDRARVEKSDDGDQGETRKPVDF